MVQRGVSGALNQLWRSPNGKLSVPLSYFHWQLDEGVTVGRAVVAGTQRLAGAGLDTPRLDSEVLLGHVLGFDRAQLYTHADRLLTDGERGRFEDLIDRRFRHEPVAYLVGRKAFYGIELAVDPRVLIPRPETELLVDLALDLLASVDHGAERHIVADVGTGSGAIALSIAANTSRAHLYATDISHVALALAAENARRLGLADRVTFLQGDLLESVPQPVHLIIANLPYIAEDEWSSLQPDIAEFEPALALSGGPDGLDLIRRLLAQAPAYLRPHGALLLEIGSRQGAEVAKLVAAALPGASVEVLMDYAYQDRIVRVMVP